MLKVLKQAGVLSNQYHVVVANPPYLGKAMDTDLNAFAKKHYQDTKSDLFAMFIKRGLEMTRESGYAAMITMQSWMFLSSYEDLRSRLVKSATIACMSHMANMVMGIAFGTAATVWRKRPNSDFKGAFCYVEYEDLNPQNTPAIFPPRNERNSQAGASGFFRASAADFKKIPGSPIAYWVSDQARNCFSRSKPITAVAPAKQGLATADNDRFLRLWFEVQSSGIDRNCNSIQRAQGSQAVWFPYNKGGPFRRWYGNQDFVVNWRNDGAEIRNFVDENGKQRSRPQNTQCYFRASVSWSDVTSGLPAFRYYPPGFIYDITGMSAQPEIEDIRRGILAFVNTTIVTWFVNTLNPTIHFQIGNFASLPYLATAFARRDFTFVQTLIRDSKFDWDAYERSWDFQSLPILTASSAPAPTLESSYQTWITQNRGTIAEMKRLEEENNRLFIDAYGLGDELIRDVPIEQITLTVNPAYRYGKKLADDEWSFEEGFGDELEARFPQRHHGRIHQLCRRVHAWSLLLGQAWLDPCQSGRHACGVFWSRFPNRHSCPMKTMSSPSWTAIGSPMTSLIASANSCARHSERRITRRNLAFLEDALGKPLRKYFLKDFYKTHVKRYKKRPIYWMFSSPKGSFNALIYMHRYTPDTASIVLNDYLHEFRVKLAARKEHLEQASISGSATARDKTAALKEIEKLKKVMDELDTYESDILYPLATQRLGIDLDDGVKVNYKKFGKALQKVTGLNA